MIQSTIDLLTFLIIIMIHGMGYLVPQKASKRLNNIIIVS